jgi:hypothetical protein
MATTKEVATKQETAPAVIIGAEAFADFEDDVETTSDDLIVPVIKLMQGGSDLVKDGVAMPGEYRKVTGEIVAERDKELEVILFKREKYNQINQMELVNGKKEKVKGTYRREPFTASGPNDWIFFEDDKEFQRTLTYAFYVILANPDGQEVFKQTPSIITLQSSGKKAAKNWYAIIQNMRTAGSPAHAFVFSLGRTKETKNNNTWLIPTVKIGRPTTQFEQEAAVLWRSEFANKEVKHEDTED